jgi:hypothetical protein
VPEERILEAERCRVGGLNHNYVSPAGQVYHIQIEDRGPLVDALTEQAVRRVNLIVYANYGEPNAHIIHGRDHDFPDWRTGEHNDFIKERIKELAIEAHQIIEDKEVQLIDRIKDAIRIYYKTKDEGAKKEFEEANALFPFLFSRAFRELKEDKERSSAASARPAPTPAAAPTAPEEKPPEKVLYPLDVELRERVIEIERLIIEVGRDLHILKERGQADDILLQTCRKLVTRAKESISGRNASEFTVRRLDVTRNSMMTTWKQIQSRLRR